MIISSCTEVIVEWREGEESWTARKWVGGGAGGERFDCWQFSPSCTRASCILIFCLGFREVWETEAGRSMEEEEEEEGGTEEEAEEEKEEEERDAEGLCIIFFCGRNKGRKVGEG